MQLQPGPQRAVLVDVGLTTSSKKGTLGVVLTFNALNEENKSIAQTQARRWVTDNTLEYVVKDLVTCGLKEDVSELKVLGEENALGKYFDEKIVSLQMGYEEYEGKQRLRVQFINEEGGAGFERLSSGDANKLIGGMKLDVKGALLKARGKTGGAQASKKSSKKETDDEKIPF